MARIRIAHIDELKPRRGIVRTVHGEDIALFIVDGAVHAVSNYCPHQHASKLHESIVEGSVITCPMHGWAFDLCTGAPVNAAGRLTKFATEVRGGIVYVDIDDAD
ncbi:MAG: Rieske (2Fe-2S) protein [Acidobacteriota bacterium]